MSVMETFVQKVEAARADFMDALDGPKFAQQISEAQQWDYTTPRVKLVLLHRSVLPSDGISGLVDEIDRNTRWRPVTDADQLQALGKRHGFDHDPQNGVHAVLSLPYHIGDLQTFTGNVMILQDHPFMTDVIEPTVFLTQTQRDLAREEFLMQAEPIIRTVVAIYNKPEFYDDPPSVEELYEMVLRQLTHNENNPNESELRFSRLKPRARADLIPVIQEALEPSTY